MATGDVNHDGFYRRAPARTGPGTRFTSHGDGLYAVATSGFTAGTDATKAVALVDMDNDGWLDFVAVNGATTSRVYLNLVAPRPPPSTG